MPLTLKEVAESIALKMEVMRGDIADQGREIERLSNLLTSKNKPAHRAKKKKSNAKDRRKQSR